MKTKLVTACFILGALLAPVVAQATDRHEDRKHPMTFVKDSVITTKIKAKLAGEKMSSLKNISVDTDAKGAVVLKGKVKTQAEADKAVEIARATEGVTSVYSNIRIKGRAHVVTHMEDRNSDHKHASRADDGDSDRKHPKAFVKDSVITIKIKAKLADEKMSSLKNISVDTDAKGAVVLSGKARTQAEADKAVAIARATEGVTSVHSNIQIKKDD